MKIKTKPFWGWAALTLIVLLMTGFLLWFLVRLLAFFVTPQEVTFGVSFSKYKAQALGLLWQETYLALLDELKVKEVRLIAHWDDIEKKPGQLDFTDIDWQLAEAGKRGVRVLMAVGYKLPGWPECHIPSWAKGFPVSEQYAALLNSLPAIINHLKNYPSIWAWQVENEPFFRFGECPTWWVRKDFLEEELSIVRSLDRRPIVITESGEGDLWLKAAKRADIVGGSVYRTVWNRYIRYSYPFTANFYRAKGGLVKLIWGRPVLLSEAQMEPWTPGVPLAEFPLDQQYLTMSPVRFRQNIALIREIGFSPAYLWGAEWWYWLATEKGEKEIWQEAQQLWR